MHLPTIGNNDFVYVATPTRFYMKTLRAISDALEEEALALSSSAPMQSALAAVTAPEKTGIDWSDPAVLTKLRKGLTVPIGVKLFDMAAAAAIAKPGESVSFTDVYQAAGFPDGQRGRSSLGAVTKVLKRDFGITFDEAKGLIERRYGLSGDAHYSMKPDVAQAWIDSAP